MVRFDDLRTGKAVAFASGRGSHQPLVATRPEEVLPVLRAVDAATAAGCWAAGFVSYEAAAGLRPGLPTRQLVAGEPFAELPLVWFGLFAGPEPGAGGPAARPAGGRRGYALAPWRPDPGPAAYRRMFDLVQDRIAAGDTYQCNLTVRLRSRATGDLLELYRDLADAQRGAYHAYLDIGRYVVASASPELFFQWCGDEITTRPMKGTAPRGRWPAEDAARAAALGRSAKDRAENVMIVDLLRNDLGKLAEPGGVRATRLFTVERYETLWQLTSTVSARPRPGTTLADVFQAMFPCGSVTGAPKHATMSLIAELETSRRGVYCGAIGVVGPPGARLRARFSVAIRTLVVDRSDGEAVYGTGGGITVDSTPDAEYAELLTKAAILGRDRGEFSLVETMGFRPGEGLRNYERHLRRLGASAVYFGFPLELDRVRAAVTAELVGVTEPSRVRVVVARDGSVRLERESMPAATGPVRLAVDLEPVDPADSRLYHKTTRRSIYQVRADRHPEADDVLLVNDRGEPTESTVANLAVRLAGRWWTPPLDAGCLPGVERERLLETGQLGERSLTLDDLLAADGLALVSSLRGWRPARLALPAPG